MQGILYEEPSFWLFLLVTCILGGGAAWITGRSMANSWQSLTGLFFAVLGLGIAVRFIHHAMFAGTMFSLRYYVVDTVVLLIIAVIGYRFTRAGQMATQYGWLYERTGPLSWRPRPETLNSETG
jgi:small-conductance mechanosensitive channel